MTMIFSLTPGLIFIIGGLLSLFAKGRKHQILVLAIHSRISSIAFLSPSDSFTIDFIFKN